MSLASRCYPGSCLPPPRAEEVGTKCWVVPHPPTLYHGGEYGSHLPDPGATGDSDSCIPAHLHTTFCLTCSLSRLLRSLSQGSPFGFPEHSKLSPPRGSTVISRPRPIPRWCPLIFSGKLTAGFPWPLTASTHPPSLTLHYFPQCICHLTLHCSLTSFLKAEHVGTLVLLPPGYRVMPSTG